jgi:cardiolipin synthase
MNLPNALSLFRLVLTIFFILLITYDRFRAALAIFMLQAVSDMLDGYFARTMGQKTALGAYLDPLADKVMLAASYLVLCFKGIVPVWLVGAVMARDLIIALGFMGLSLLSLRTVPTPTYISKATTAFQMLTIVYVLWSHTRGYDVFFYYATAVLTVLSGLQYIMVGVNALIRKETV